MKMSHCRTLLTRHVNYPNREKIVPSSMYLTGMTVCKVAKAVASVNKTKLSSHVPHTHTSRQLLSTLPALGLRINKQTGQTPAGRCLRDRRGGGHARGTLAFICRRKINQ